MSEKIKKARTTIDENVRRTLDISRDEYALCGYIHYRCAFAGQKVPGWCSDSKEDVAQFVGMSRPGLYKMIDRLEVKNLLETNPINGAIRSTAHWTDVENGLKSVNSVYSTDEKSVNKVYNECKQSLQSVSTKFTESVNKVTHNIAVKDDIVRVSKTKKKDAGAGEKEKNEQIPLNQEKMKSPPSSAPPPPKREAPVFTLLNLRMITWLKMLLENQEGCQWASI